MLVCSECGAKSDKGTDFCLECGARLDVEKISESGKNNIIKKTTKPQQEVNNNQKSDVKREIQTTKNSFVEPIFALAEGLPEWSLEPPQLLVRRKRS